MDIGTDILIILAGIVIGVIITVATIIVPILKRSIKESKEHQELQDKIRAERNHKK